MVIMFDHVSLPVQALSNTTLIMLCSMVRNLSFHVSRFSYKNKVMVIKVGRTLTRHRYVIRMPCPNVFKHELYYFPWDNCQRYSVGYKSIRHLSRESRTRCMENMWHESHSLWIYSVMMTLVPP